MDAHVYFTSADAERDYQETRRALAGQTSEELIREYHAANRDGLNAMFGHNARRFGNLVVDELLKRGVTTVPNIFGPITVARFRS